MSVARDYLQTVGKWITEGAPDDAIPEEPMAAIAAMRLVDQELAVEGIPERNLATFVTTGMEPEPRIVPLEEGKYTIGPEDIEPPIDENTIGVAAVVGTTFTGHADDVVGINDFLVELKDKKGLDVPLHIDGASGAFVWPFLYPHSEWDFRLGQVRSINASGHKFGLVYPGVGWLIFREKSDLAENLVFYENYLGKTDATFTLNFSTGSSMVIAQYYNFVRFGRDGYRYLMEVMQSNAKLLADRLQEIGRFKLIGK